LIYPEKAVLKENAIQTIRPNRAIELICRPSADLNDPKTKMAFKNEDHSNVVSQVGEFSNQLREDIRRMGVINSLIYKR